MEQLVPHPRVVDKNLGEISQEQGGPDPHQYPQPRVPIPGTPHNFWLQKSAGIELVEETAGAPSSSS